MLQAGTRIGRYEVIGPLGAGGMGEVYRALDSSLDRIVALKVLPEAFSSEPDRAARFQREARTLASLNHPSIAQIYGAESAGTIQALAMELVEGEDLSQRIERGAIPLEDALQIARQIAEALEAAHEQGIIHRDLKPANVKITPDGAVKVLDFGLAKALDPALSSSGGGDAAIMNSPTMSIAGTAAGLILGTAAYMAPEQARGQMVDRRVDVWAFGVVLFEMLTGGRAFEGETISDVLASVLKNDLDWTRLPADVPPPILSLLHRCLTADRRNRLRDIGEARIAIAEFLARPAATVAAEPIATRRAPRMAWWWYAVTAMLALLLVAVLFDVWRPRANAAPVIRYLVSAPAKMAIEVTSRPALSLSRDGRLLVFAAVTEDSSRLYMQRREEFDVRPIAGTDGASGPVISPDGRLIAFDGAAGLTVVSLDGAPRVLSKVNDSRGHTWVDDKTIVYAPEAIGGMFEIAAGGGVPRAITQLKAEAGERTHRWPAALPDGRHVLFTVGTVASPDNYDDSVIDVVDRQTGERRTVMKGAAMARYSPTGHLLFVHAGALFAIGFDVKTLSTRGAAVPVLEGVGTDVTTGAAHVAWADDGTLAYVSGDVTGGLRQIVSVSRKGEVTPIELRASDTAALYNDVRISPDGSRFAVAAGTSGRADIWVYHFARRTFTRLTFSGTNATPVWSADGRDLYCVSIVPTGRKTVVLRMSADGGAEGTEVASFDGRAYLAYVSRDGSWGVAAESTFGGNKSDIVRFTMGAKPQFSKLVATPSDEYGSSVSPDGRWLAYQSDETGRFEVYVRAVDGAGGRWQVSNSGGEEPMWSHDGREMYFRTGNRLLKVPIELTPGFRSGVPSLLFDGVYNLRSDTGISYDVDPVSDRFLMTRQIIAAPSLGAIRVVRNWFDEMKQTLAGAK